MKVEGILPVLHQGTAEGEKSITLVYLKRLSAALGERETPKCSICQERAYKLLDGTPLPSKADCQTNKVPMQK